MSVSYTNNNDSETKYVQVQLKKTNANETITCWVRADKRLKEKRVTTLKGKEGRWVIVEIYSNVLLYSHQLHTDWNVGGLD